MLGRSPVGIATLRPLIHPDRIELIQQFTHAKIGFLGRPLPQAHKFFIAQNEAATQF